MNPLMYNHADIILAHNILLCIFTFKMLLQMERDNLTDALNEWKTNGDSRLDLAAPTLYKDFVSGALTSNSLMDSMTQLVQMIQGDSINIVFGFRYSNTHTVP